MATDTTADVGREPGGPTANRAVIAMIAAVTVFDGYDVFVPAYVIHYVREPWGLSATQAGALVSSGLVGFMVGALANGPLADRFGRRPVLLAALWLAGLGNIATALLAQGLGSFVATRVVTGIGLGMIMPIITAYLNEFMPGRSSNVATIVASSGYTVGGVLAGLAGIFLTPAFGWTILFLIGGIGCVVAAALQRILPESPMFVRGTRAARGPLRLLVGTRYLRDSLVLWSGAALALFNIYALSAWIPSVMIGRGAGFSLGFFYGSLLQLAGLAGGFACATLCDRWGSRRGPLVLWYGLLAVSLAALGATSVPVLNLILVTAAGFFLIGAQPVFNNLAAHSYPTEARSTGVGMMLGVGRVGAIAGPLVIGAVQGVTTGDTVLFAIMAGAAACGALVLLASSDRAIEAAPTGDRRVGEPARDAPTRADWAEAGRRPTTTGGD